MGDGRAVRSPSCPPIISLGDAVGNVLPIFCHVILLGHAQDHHILGLFTIPTVYSQYLFLYLISLCMYVDLWLVKNFYHKIYSLQHKMNGLLYRWNIALFCTKMHNSDHIFPKLFWGNTPRFSLQEGATPPAPNSLAMRGNASPNV